MESAHQGQYKIFYDGLCRVCSAEIETYRKMKGSEAIQFVDITSPDFDSQKENLDPKLIHQELHAKDPSGATFVGVEAFILIWSQLPHLKWLSRLAKQKWLNAFLRLNYSVFVKVRPYLPRKSCETSPYCSTKL